MTRDEALAALSGPGAPFEQTVVEDVVQGRVAAGHTIRGLYPMTDPATRELLAAWRDAVSATGCQADATLLESLFVAAWGGRRYLLRVQPPLTAEAWIAQMQHICTAALAPTSTTRA